MAAWPVLLSLTVPVVFAEGAFEAIRDEARASEAGFELLTEICDRFGGRLAGSPSTKAAMDWLADRLREEGLEPRFERFAMPSWERREDEVTMLAPVARPLRIAAIGYTAPCPTFEAEVVDIKTGSAQDFDGLDTAGRIGLLSAHTDVPRGELERRTVERGLRAVLRVNREGGGQLLARTGGFTGAPLPIPVFSITQEEGTWIRRLLERGEKVRLRVTSRSRPFAAETANLSVRFPGRSGAKIVVAGHFDSWDLGQGAIDNGLAIAQLFEIARLLRKHSPENHHAVDVVWLEGEELGLWGARERARLDKAEPVVAMINLDMVGWPKSVNALGAQDLLPVLERYRDALGDGWLPDGVDNTPWAASDHTPYMLAGIRSITYGAPIPRDSVRYYHDLADTIDKVDPAMLREGSSAAAALVYALASDPSLEPRLMPREEIISVFQSKGVDVRLRNDGLWPFAEAESQP